MIIWDSVVRAINEALIASAQSGEIDTGPPEQLSQRIQDLHIVL